MGDDAPLGLRLRAWANGRTWWWRALLFVGLMTQVFPSLRAQGAWTLFSGITFGAHELGHLFWMPFGEWMGVAGGSLTQLLVPVGAAAAMRRSKDWFGVAACGLFLAASLADLSWYIGDARAELMDLVSFSEEGAIHDWNYLLRSMGLLRSDRQLAGFTRFVAWMVLLASSVLAARLCLWMATDPPPQDGEARPRR